MFPNDLYIVIPNALVASPEELQVFESYIAQKTDQVDPIFNTGDQPDIGDGKRKQLCIGPGSGPLEPFIEKFRDILYDLIPTGRYIIHDLALLISEPGCQDQPAHSDWTEESLSSIPNSDEYPMGCLLALEDNTAFNVWPGASCNDANISAEMLRVKLNAGDLLLFRADLIHGGASYIQRNIRLHAYLDVRRAKRRKNETYFITIENTL
jgi:hypothetical protein